MLSLFPLFLIFMFLGVPIAYSIGITVWLSLLYGGIPTSLISIRLTGFQMSHTLIAIPLFIAATGIMSQGSMTKRIIDWCMALVGWIRGGLAQINVLVSVIFAGISGSGIADVASIGPWLIPSMKKRGFPVEYAAAITVASATISPVIPPSNSLILIAILAETSVVGLFMAGIIPGLLMGVVLMIVCYYLAVKHNHPRENTSFSFKYLRAATISASLDLALPIVIIGGIRFGLYTAVEGSAVALAYALLLTGIIRKELNWEKLKKVSLQATMSAAIVVFLIGMASSLSYIITLERIPDMVASFMIALQVPYWVLVLLLMAVMVLCGMVMDGLSVLLIFTPVIIPIRHLLHMPNLNQLILFLHMAAGIGMLTPPVGVGLFLAARIAKTDILRIARAAIPFIIALIGVVLLVGYVPSLTTWLSSM